MYVQVIFGYFTKIIIVEPLYRQLQNNIKSQILSGELKEGDLLPSEFELQQLHKITRSTVRMALNQLVNEGYIIKKQGKGSIVAKIQRRTLGLLSVKGFSQIVGEHKQTVRTVMIDKPTIVQWEPEFFYIISEIERKAGCIYMKRLRCVEVEPVMLETTFISNINLPRFCSRPFVKDSLFETLNSRYEIEITQVEQDLRAVLAGKETASHLNIQPGSPILQILLKFYTNREKLFVYSSLLCNTTNYSIGNNL